MKLERQAQHEAKAERQRLRAERAETRRAKRKRHHRRQQLRGVHPQDYDQIEVVDDALDFELEAEEALEGDTEILEAELQPLPSDPIDRVLLLELTPTQQQHTELLRREYMKACSDYHARLSRYLPEYVEAFSLSSWDPASFAADTQGRLTDYAGALNRVGNGTPLDDRALDCDFQLRPFGLSRYSAPASSLPVPPSQERFWLTEAELSEPELRAQRAMEVQPHIDHHVQVVVKHQEEVAAARAAFNAERDARAAAAGFSTYLQMDNAILKREHPGPFLPSFKMSDQVPPGPCPCPCIVCKSRAEAKERSDQEWQKRKRAEDEHAWMLGIRWGSREAHAEQDTIARTLLSCRCPKVCRRVCQSSYT